MSLTDTIVNWIAANGGASRSADAVTLETPLLDEGMLDSLQIVNLITFLEEEAGVAIDMDEVVPENFATINDIIRLVERAGGRPSPET